MYHAGKTVWQRIIAIISRASNVTINAQLNIVNISLTGNAA